ncbi:MAG: hypothetical protein FWD61_10110 [Phycisphaerales bacterium]|nr:hypothetical protein [Phycisphaerales bacterium]
MAVAPHKQGLHGTPENRGRRGFLLQQEAAAKGGGGDIQRKPLIDVADVLLMSRVDSHPAPLTASKTGEEDVLDSLVHEHLERTIAPKVRPPGDGDEKQAPSDEQEYVNLSSSDRAPQDQVDLQKEIDALFAGELRKGVGRGETPIDSPVAPAKIENLSNEEFAVLVPGGKEEGKEGDEGGSEVMNETKSVAAETATASTPSEPMPAEKVLEAEGVLAEELAQLMAETQAAAGKPPASPKPKMEAAEPPQQGDVELTATVQSIVQGKEMLEEEKKQEFAEQPSEATDEKLNELLSSLSPKPEVLSQKPDESLAAATTPAPTEQAESATAEPATAPSLSSDVSEQPLMESALSEGPRKSPGLLTQISRGATGFLVLILEVVNLPFGWVREWDKNLIGIAAICLLLGGCVLYAWAWWLAHHGF